MQPLTTIQYDPVDYSHERSPADRADLPVAEWHQIHDTALNLHRSGSIEAALDRLAEFVERYGLGTRLRAVLSDGSEPKLLLRPSRNSDTGRPSDSDCYRANFDIEFREKNSLRISLDLPTSKSIRDQVKLELLLEHFSIAAQHLPIGRE